MSGCQSTKCRKCGNSFPACQLRDGLCGTCRPKVDTTPPPSPKNPNYVRTY